MKQYINFSIAFIFAVVLFGAPSQIFAQSNPSSDFRWETPPEGFEDLVVGESIAFGDGVFVGVFHPPIGADSYIRTSTDGETWVTRVTTLNPIDWINVIYGNGKFVAIGVNSDDQSINVITQSTDGGVTWSTPQTISAIGSSYIRNVTYGDGLFMAATDNSVSTSVDGINWTPFDTSLPTSTSIKDIMYGNNRFVMVAYTSGGSNIGKTFVLEKVATAWVDSWQEFTSPEFSSSKNYSLAYGNGNFIATPIDLSVSGSNDTLYVSSDGGVTWSSNQIVIQDFDFTDFTSAISYGGDLFVVVVRKFVPGNGKAVPPTVDSNIYYTLTSSDYGQTWQLTEETPTGVNFFKNDVIAYGNDIFVLIPTLVDENGLPDEVIFARWPITSEQPEEAPSRSHSSSKVSSKRLALLQETFAQADKTPSDVKEETPTSGATEVRNLFFGMKGTDVRMLQNILIAAGHAIPAGPTEFFGSQTRQALSQYQTAHNISPAVGYFGPITRAQMKSGLLENLWW